MKVFMFIAAFTLLIPLAVFSQHLDWVRQLGGVGNDMGYGIATDAAGNVYTSGVFTDTLDFDPGPGTYNLISAGGEDIFISKLDGSGNFIWARQLGGNNREQGGILVTDDTGNVYIAGGFNGTADFDPGLGTYYLTSSSLSYDDIFICKLDSAGNFVWAKQLGGTGQGWISSINLDTSGNVYTTGRFKGTVDFDPGTGTYNLTRGGGNYNIFISKLDKLGNFVWAKQFEGIANSRGGASSIALDTAGNIYTTGYFGGTFDFDPGVGIYNLTTTIYSIFISKLDSAGNFVWTKHFGNGNIISRSLAIDPVGDIYITGDFENTVDFDPGAGTYNLTAVGVFNDVFISKLDGSGNFIWAKQLGGVGQSYSNFIRTDAAGNVYTTGYFNSTLDCDPGVGTHNLTTTGTNEDVFISKLDGSGNFIWAAQLGGTNWMGGRGLCLALDPAGDVYTTGFFYGTADFDPGSGTHHLTANNYDVFVHKMSTVTGIAETKSLEGVFVYPNPVTDMLTIEVKKKAQLTIYDALGRRVLARALTAGKNKLLFNQFSSGIYTLKITSEETVFYGKIVKE